MPSTINADNGVVSGSAGLKSSADASGVLQLQTNGTTAVTVDTSQNVLVNATTARTNVGLTLTPIFQVEGTGASSSSMSFIRNADNANPPRLYFGKSRGTTLNSNTIVQILLI